MLYLLTNDFLLCGSCWTVPVKVVLLCVHQFGDNLPLVPPGVVLVRVHARLLLAALLSWYG